MAATVEMMGKRWDYDYKHKRPITLPALPPGSPPRQVKLVNFFWNMLVEKGWEPVRNIRHHHPQQGDSYTFYPPGTKPFGSDPGLYA